MTRSPIAHVRSDIFEPPPTPLDRRRRRSRRIAAVLAVVIVVPSLLWGGNLAYRDLACGPIGNGIARVDGQCVGVTDGTFIFHPDIEQIQQKIRKENERVRNGGYGDLPYVRVAVLMPMTADDRSALTMARIRYSLQGAYVAQRRANGGRDDGFGDPTPLIELLLANEGSNQQQWRPTVSRLTDMITGAHPLVAVVGLGVSIPDTQLAAEELSRHQVAAVGAVLTADTLRADSFVQVSPSNGHYALALKNYLDKAYPEGHRDRRRGIVVYDQNSDMYTRTLRQAYEQHLEDFMVEGPAQQFNGILNEEEPIPLFDHVSTQVCAAKAVRIFYAGRVKELKNHFIPSLARKHCAEREENGEQLTIMLGATGLSSLHDKETVDLLKRHRIRVVYASSIDAIRWNGRAEDLLSNEQEHVPQNDLTGMPVGYPSFYQKLHELLSTGEADDALADGYTAMHHDAVATAVLATRQAARERKEAVPTHKHVAAALWKLNILGEVAAASGTLSFSPEGLGWPSGKPIPVLSIPPDAQPPLPTSKPYIT